MLIKILIKKCFSPLRAYLLDVCNSKDVDTGLNIQAILGGIGAATGYLLTALFYNEQVLYIISATVFIICLISTLTSAKEKPLSLRKKSNNNFDGKIFNF